MLRTALAATAALTGFGIAIVEAQERAPVSWDLTLENDRWGDGADRHYTHGTRVTRSSDAVPRWVRKVAAPLHCLACTDPHGFELQLGQEIYTPENIWSAAVIADDRPYAGWAYGAVTVHGERDASNGRRKAVNALTFELGVVGPASLADRTQALLHRKRDFPVVRGWENQLENEVGAVVTYKRGIRKLLGREGSAVRHDVSPYFEGALGNVRTHVGGGVRWRTGRNLESASVVEAPGWRLFADVNARVVGRNALLDGNANGGRHAVPKEPVVVRAAAGLEYRTTRFSVSLARERRGREFIGQREPDEFGAISFTLTP
jgi:hypothetical protein